jgi:hypothetical protein
MAISPALDAPGCGSSPIFGISSHGIAPGSPIALSRRLNQDPLISASDGAWHNAHSFLRKTGGNQGFRHLMPVKQPVRSMPSEGPPLHRTAIGYIGNKTSARSEHSPELKQHLVIVITEIQDIESQHGIELARQKGQGAQMGKMKTDPGDCPEPR